MSGSSRRIAGVIALTIDGDTWDVVGDAEYCTANTERSTVKGQSRVEGYSEMPKEVYFSANLRDRSDATVLSLNGKTNATIIAMLANGKTFYGAGMWQTGEIAVRTQEGSFNIKF